MPIARIPVHRCAGSTWSAYAARRRYGLRANLNRTAPRQRNDPDFPLRGYVRCAACGKTLTASWSKGRSDYYACYHCRNGCRAVNVAKTKLEEILGFAERILPSASNLWVQSSVAQKQRLQQVFFPDGVRFDGKRLVGTGTTLPVFNYLDRMSDEKKEVVDLTGIEPVTS